MFFDDGETGISGLFDFSCRLSRRGFAERMVLAREAVHARPSINRESVKIFLECIRKKLERRDL